MALKIGVIIRLYNGIEFLDECITSVISQTYREWTCIIGVNGHGKDGNVVHQRAIEVIKSKNDPRIQVINYPEANGGADILNRLVHDTEAEWIAVLDVDDIWHMNKLENQVRVIHTVIPVPDIIGTGCVYFGDRDYSPGLPEGFIDKEVFEEKNPILHSSVVMRKCIANYRNIVYLHDYDLWCRLSLENKVFFNLPELLTAHRIHEDSFYNNKNSDMVDELRAIYFKK